MPVKPPRRSAPRPAWGSSTPPQRTRGRKLQRLRKQLFDQHPLCVPCLARGIERPATVRDHVIPLAEGGQDVESNVRAICQTCSDAKTQSESLRGRNRVSSREPQAQAGLTTFDDAKGNRSGGDLSQGQVGGRRRPGPAPLPVAEKARRGTLKPARERSRAVAGSSVAVTSSQPDVPPVTSRDFPAIAAAYQADVLSGRIRACKWVRLACQRQARDLRRAVADPAWGYAWSPSHVTAACELIERLPHVEGAWTTKTITLEPVQVFLVACFFGWRHASDPTRRRFTLLYLEMGRKSAKSTLMAAIAFCHLLLEDEPGASVICGATTGAQARIVFSIMQRMVRRSAWLREQGIEAFANAITTTDGTAKPINAKASTQDGLNPSCIVLDESHAQNFALHDVLKSAQGARRNPMMLAPTTAGYDLLSVGYALRTTLTKVLGEVFEADHFFGAIFTLDEGDDWRDERAWVKANPMLGVTPKLEWVRLYAADAALTPGIEGEFKVKVCSLWAQAGSAWLSITAWDQCADPHIRLEQFAGESCWIGADLAQTDDIAAVALVFRRGDLLYGFIRCYLPQLVVDERARVVPAYREWAQAGVLRLTEGNLIDYAVIEADIRAWCEQLDVRHIAFDQYGAVSIASALAASGYRATTVTKNAKTFTPAARELEARVKVGQFRHDGNQCLRWMASNCVVTRRIDDTILPKKETPDSPNKIDGIDALLLAIGSMLDQPMPVRSIYDEPSFDPQAAWL